MNLFNPIDAQLFPSDADDLRPIEVGETVVSRF